MANTPSTDYAQLANQLGEFFVDTSEQLGDYLDATIDDPNDPKAIKLGEQIDELGIYANRLFDLAQNIAFADLAINLQGVKDGTTRINQAVKTIANIDKAIAIAAAVIELAAAIVTQNGSALGAAVQTIASV
jgi:hypothetical protein